ncbi:methyltransferase domain-containing protein [Rutstroemia sp. NJR-2017a WRK4]|nr:methyltransferase domain-containing protein [Rutstroemia sp. NJR-2017a WRK4]
MSSSQTAPFVPNAPTGNPTILKSVDLEKSNVEHAESESKKVDWYQPEIKALPSSTMEVFKNYAGFQTEEEMKTHIYRVRDKAWKVIHLSPEYPNVVSRLQNGETLLDLGCCFGQDLRKAAYDSGSSSNLYGADLEGQFIELGYELFQDKDKFNGQFNIGSVFDDSFMADCDAKFDMIYLGSFLHLFNAQQQRAIARKVNRMLKPKAGSMAFGRNLGAEEGGEYHLKTIGWDMYRHSNETIRKLWEHENEGKWQIDSFLTKNESEVWDKSRRGWQESTTQMMVFVAKRV